MRIGFRAWGLDFKEDKFILNPQSHTQAGAWVLGGVTESTCLAEDAKRRQHPVSNCSCGLHHYYQPNKMSGNVVGAVMCWGKITGHGDEGFRAQYGRILAVLKPDSKVYPAPPPPVPDGFLVSNLYVLKFSQASIEEFTEAIKDLYKLEPSLPPSLKWVMPSAQEIEAIYAEMQEKSEKVHALQRGYDEQVQNHKQVLTDFINNRERLFLEQMPFPVFDTLEELVKFAGKFGDFGPPEA